MGSTAQPIPPGTRSPDFSYRDAAGTSRSTADLRGHSYIVYFYPKDDTPGCTKEACGFRDAYDAFQEAGMEVIGISPDSDASHEKFRQKYQLPFGLAADADHELAEQFGVWGHKKFMGREYDGVHRTTFVIDAEGRVEKVFPKVSPATHVGEVLETLNRV